MMMESNQLRDEPKMGFRAEIVKTGWLAQLMRT